MNDFYDDMADVSAEMLEEFGQAIALIRTTDGVYDPNTSRVVGATTSTFTGFGAAFEYEQRAIDGTNIRIGDRRVYLGPTLGTTPQTGDTLILADGTRLSVVRSRPLSPAGIVVLHEVQGRGL